MKSDVRISAVIPTFNRDRLVGKAIESALSQEFPPSEIIVVDDGSSDDTRSVVQSYGTRVRYLYQPNSGVSVARNRGVRESRFEWIAFLDSDDYWAPEHLKRIERAIVATHGAAALYFADLRMPDAEGGNRYWASCGFEPSGDWECRQDAGEWALMRVQPMMLQASVISRQRYWEVGGLAEQLRTREDTLLFFKLGLLYPACAVSGCGTVQNSLDGIRLTRVYDGNTMVFLSATVTLYKELLAFVSGISLERRQLLVEGLGCAYYATGRFLARQHEFVGAFKNLASACRVSPSVFVREVYGTLSRRFLQKPEKPCMAAGVAAK
jgi:glycosyltransferase involved in cell wall biosynthesis